MVVNSNNRKKIQIFLFILIAVTVLGVGYAAISAVNLIINGDATASVNQNNFKVYFTTANITTGTGTASIDENDNTIAYLDITGLSKVGDTATATYTILNNSNAVGAEISLNLTNSNSDYFKVTERIDDNKLQAGENTTATVTIELLKTPLDSDVSTSVSAKLIATPVENASAVGGVDKAKVEPTPFASDSWETIKTNVQNGNTSQYNIGDTRLIEINGANYVLRLSNKSSHEWCDNEAYSQSACGFVVEFAEVIEKRKMYPASTNSDGWPGSTLYGYLNGEFYNGLPSDLKTSILSTRIISGFGCEGSDYDYDNHVCNSPLNNGNNFVSNDKIYLLSGVEVFGQDDWDTAAGTTTQLDYYQGMEGIMEELPEPHYVYPTTYKGYQGSDGSSEYWWLRTPRPNHGDGFRVVGKGILKGNGSGGSDGGVSPAFRIG